MRLVPADLSWANGRYRPTAARRVWHSRLRARPRLVEDVRADSAGVGHRRDAKGTRAWDQLSRRRALQRRDGDRTDEEWLLGDCFRRAVPGFGLEARRGRARQQALVGVLA